MSKHKRVDVRILNPIAGRGYTSRKCATRYVQRGIARWAKDGHGRDCLEFLAEGFAAIVKASVKRVVDHTVLAYDRAASVGMARMGDLANLPMVAPGVLLGVGRNTGARRLSFTSPQGF